MVFNDARLIEIAHNIVDQEGFLPSYDWFKANGYYEYLKSVSNFGGLPKLRSLVDKRCSLYRLTSRSGLSHRSLPEVCLANFLWARGIQIWLGRQYPAEYSIMSGKSYGMYDLEFDALSDTLKGQRILVEVWGDKEIGESRSVARVESYSKTKALKIEFNKNNAAFLGLQYDKCYNESDLQSILKPYIGELPIIKTKEDYDHCFVPTVWTLADEVLYKCRKVIEITEDGVLPVTAWFTRSGEYENRKIYDFEPKSWLTFLGYAAKIGGMVKIREILGKQSSRYSTWNKENIIQAAADFYKANNCWPIAVRHRYMGKADVSEQEKALVAEGMKIHTAIYRQFENIDDCYKAAAELLSINIRPIFRALPKGISMNQGKYRARFTRNTKVINVGAYVNLKDAEDALDRAQTDYDKKLLSVDKSADGEAKKNQTLKNIAVHDNKYKVKFGYKTKTYYVGVFDDLEEAKTALYAARAACISKDESSMK